MNFGLYTVDSFANIFSAGMDLVTTFFGLTFYCLRVQEYGKTLDYYSPAFFWDIGAIVAFSFGVLTIIYRLFFYIVYL